jgi:hypothetical protein
MRGGGGPLGLASGFRFPNLDSQLPEQIVFVDVSGQILSSFRITEGLGGFRVKDAFRALRCLASLARGTSGLGFEFLGCTVRSREFLGDFGGHYSILFHPDNHQFPKSGNFPTSQLSLALAHASIRLAVVELPRPDLPNVDPEHLPTFATKREMAVELLQWASKWLGSRGEPLWLVDDGADAKAPLVKPVMKMGVTVVGR